MDKDTLGSIAEVLTSADKVEAIKELVSTLDKDKITEMIDGVGELSSVIPEEHRSSIKEFALSLVDKFFNKG